MDITALGLIRDQEIEELREFGLDLRGGCCIERERRQPSDREVVRQLKAQVKDWERAHSTPNMPKFRNGGRRGV